MSQFLWVRNVGWILQFRVSHRLQSRWQLTCTHLWAPLGKDVLPGSLTWLLDWGLQVYSGCWLETSLRSLQNGSLHTEFHNMAAGFHQSQQVKESMKEALISEVTSHHFCPLFTRVIFFKNTKRLMTCRLCCMGYRKLPFWTTCKLPEWSLTTHKCFPTNKDFFLQNCNTAIKIRKFHLINYYHLTLSL